MRAHEYHALMPHTPLVVGGSVVLPLCHVVMRFLFLRQDTSVFLQRGGLCEAHRMYTFGLGLCLGLCL